MPVVFGLCGNWSCSASCEDVSRGVLCLWVVIRLGNVEHSVLNLEVEAYWA